MPRVRQGPTGPKSNLAGKSGTNRPASAPKGSSPSAPSKSNLTPPTKGKYG